MLGEGAEAKKRKAQLKCKWVEKKLVDIASLGGLNNFLKKVEGSAAIPWCLGKTGRPRLVTTSDLQDIAASLRESFGRTTDREQFESEALEKGKSTLGEDFRPSEQTIRTMMVILVQLHEQELRDLTPIEKTNTRQTAENSLMMPAAMAFGVTIAGTQVLLGPDPSGKPFPVNLLECCKLFIKKAGSCGERRS